MHLLIKSAYAIPYSIHYLIATIVMIMINRSIMYKLNLNDAGEF